MFRSRYFFLMGRQHGIHTSNLIFRPRAHGSGSAHCSSPDLTMSSRTPSGVHGIGLSISCTNLPRRQLSQSAARGATVAGGTLATPTVIRRGSPWLAYGQGRCGSSEHSIAFSSRPYKSTTLCNLSPIMHRYWAISLNPIASITSTRGSHEASFSMRP